MKIIMHLPLLLLTPIVTLLSFLSPSNVHADILDCPCPQILAHRGASGDYPQGTWLAFQNALDMGSDVLELDVHLSKDEHVIINHDADLQATTGNDAKISDLTLDAIKQLDAGYTFTKDGGTTHPYRGIGLEILTLSELFSYFPNQRFSIEIKPNSNTLAQAVISKLQEFEVLNNVVVASIHPAVHNYLREQDLPITTSASSTEIAGHTVLWSIGLGFLINPKYDVAQLPDSTTAAPFVELLQSKGVAVQVWTVNDRERIGHFLDMGVDGVIGNYPDRIYDEMVLRGMR